MGGAGAAASSDANALFWNPARLAWTTRGEFSLFRTQLFTDGIGYHAGFLSYPTVDLGSFALGYQRLGIDGLERRDDRNVVLGDFSSNESHLLVGWGGRPAATPFAYGLGVRMQQQEVDGFSGLGVGIDAGLAWDRPLGARGNHSIGAGLVVQNLVEPTLKLDQEKVPDPRSLRFGLSWVRDTAGERFQWAVAADAELPRLGDAGWGGGLEVGFDRMLFVRAGLDDGRPTFGVGAATHGVSFSYAMLDDEDLSRNDRFTLAVQFGATVDDRRDARLQRREDDVRRELELRLQQREQQELEQARNSADQAFSQGRWGDAAADYGLMLLIEPENEHARRRLEETERARLLADADATLGRGEAARAAAIYQQVLELWPGEARAVEGIAQSRERLRRATDRKRQLDDLLRDALARFAEGDFPSTVRTLDELLRLEPDYELATELRDRAEGLRIQNGEAHLAEAHARADASRWDAAFTQLTQARRLLTERATELDQLRLAWVGRRDAELAETRAERARAEAALLARAAPEPSTEVVASRTRRAPLSEQRRRELEASYRRGLSAFQSGDFDLATRVWQGVWDEAPTFEDVADHLVKAYLLQGIQLYGQGDYATALDRCRRVLTIEPENPKAQRYLARIEEERLELKQIRGR